MQVYRYVYAAACVYAWWLGQHDVAQAARGSQHPAEHAGGEEEEEKEEEENHATGFTFNICTAHMPTMRVAAMTISRQ
jgi:hypothetical protein